MSDLNYTMLPEAVADTLKSAGHGLTEHQRILLMGAMLYWQSMIDKHGLAWVVQKIEHSYEAKEDGD